MRINEELIVLLICIFVVFLAVTATITGIYLSDLNTCKAKTNAIGCKYEYGFWKGCVVVKQDGQKVLLEQLRDIGY